MPKLAEMPALRVRQWLIAHGHKPAKVAAVLVGTTIKQRKVALDALHRAHGPHSGGPDKS